MNAREQLLSDVIVTAIEGGTGYWAAVAQYQWTDDRDGTVYVCVPGGKQYPAPSQGTCATLIDEDDGTVHVLTPEVIAFGMDRINSGTVGVRKDLAAAIHDAVLHPEDADIDAEAADVIVQAAIFNDIVYG